MISGLPLLKRKRKEMKVKFYIRADESDIYEFPDDTPDYVIEQKAYQWVDDNAVAEYEIIGEDEC